MGVTGILFKALYSSSEVSKEWASSVGSDGRSSLFRKVLISGVQITVKCMKNIINVLWIVGGETCTMEYRQNNCLFFFSRCRGLARYSIWLIGPVYKGVAMGHETGSVSPLWKCHCRCCTIPK